jgi:hypothetical protein
MRSRAMNHITSAKDDDHEDLEQAEQELQAGAFSNCDWHRLLSDDERKPGRMGLRPERLEVLLLPIWRIQLHLMQVIAPDRVEAS